MVKNSILYRFLEYLFAKVFILCFYYQFMCFSVVFQCRGNGNAAECLCASCGNSTHWLARL